MERTFFQNKKEKNFAKDQARKEQEKKERELFEKLLKKYGEKHG